MMASYEDCPEMCDHLEREKSICFPVRPACRAGLRFPVRPACRAGLRFPVRPACRAGLRGLPRPECIRSARAGLHC